MNTSTDKTHRRSYFRGPAATSLLPATLYIGLGLLAPITYLLVLSFVRTDPVYGIVYEFTLQNYERLLSNPVYRNSLLGTFRLAFLVSMLCLLIGYPVAYFIASSRSWFAPALTAIVVLPLFVSVVVRSFGWIVLLGRQGGLSSLLVTLGVTEEPMQMVYTYGAVVVGLVHILVPLMILPLASVMRSIDPVLLEAAESLGATNWKTFMTVVIPLSMPGIVVGFVLVFAHVLAVFVLPALIGPDSIRLAATIIYQQVMVAGNISIGAALGVVLVITACALLIVAHHLSMRLAR